MDAASVVVLSAGASWIIGAIIGDAVSIRIFVGAWFVS